MDSRERTRRAVTFHDPDRVPLEWYTLEGEEDRERSDIVSVLADLFSIEEIPVDPAEGRVRWRDIWGCVWERMAGYDTIGQVVGHPLADDRALARFETPSADPDRRFAGVARKVAAQRADRPRYVLGLLGNLLWERLHFLRGMERAMIDLYERPDLLGEVADRITAFHVTSIAGYAEAGVDAVAFAEDWGCQDRLLIPHSTWRAFFKPRYARIVQAAHAGGLAVYMHSCGWIFEIIEDLIEIGIDIVELDQPELFGIERLDDAYGGRICFDCPVDIQRVLISNERDRIRTSARRMVERLGGHRGGFIARMYPKPLHIRVTAEAHAAAYEAFIEFGRRGAR
ncbi:MAG: hypothetical protein JXP34_21140 [Planctomycetes bacterium]|nr:hypothetical protein [Planctomycetota bacterium]